MFYKIQNGFMRERKIFWNTSIIKEMIDMFSNGDNLTDEEIQLMSKRDILNYMKALTFTDDTSRASSYEIEADIEDAQKGDFPIVMCGTYHSVGKVITAAKNTSAKNAG